MLTSQTRRRLGVTLCRPPLMNVRMPKKTTELRVFEALAQILGLRVVPDSVC